MRASTGGPGAAGEKGRSDRRVLLQLCLLRLSLCYDRCPVTPLKQTAWGVDAVEFIIPLSGVLTEFNKGKGGIAHVAYLVDDINAVSEEVKAMGYELLEKEPQEGTEDIIVNFIRPKYTQGILVELIQQVGDINYDATFTSRWGNEK